MPKRYRLGALVAVPFLAVCALLSAAMPGASVASASTAATSVATRSTAPSSLQGPRTHARPDSVDTLIAYPEIQDTTKKVICSAVATAAATHNHYVIATATAACIGAFIRAFGWQL